MHDPVIKRRFEHGPQNATYLSPDIQLDLLQVMVDMVRNSITEEVHKAGYYSLLADGSKDINKTEQMAVVVRYTDETAVIYERFLTFVEVKDLTAAGSSRKLLSVLESFKLDPSNMVQYHKV